MRAKTLISTPGRWNSPRHTERGFTLIELVVVVAIIGTILFQTLPRFTDFFANSGFSTPLKQTLELVTELKARARIRNQDYIMHVEPLAGLIWVSRPEMTEEDIQIAKDKAIRFKGDMVLVDAEIMESTEDENSGTTFLFSKKGYTQLGIIHFRDDFLEYSLPMEPYLTEPRIKNGHLTLEEYYCF